MPKNAENSCHLKSVSASVLIENITGILVGLSSSKKPVFACVTESPLKSMKNAYFVLKALFVLKIFEFLSWLFGHIEKTAWLER